MSFQGTQITEPSLAAVRTASADWELMLVTILRTLVDRFERRNRSGEYPFVDSKLSLLTGLDHPTPANPTDEARDFKGPTALYGWIQGRGLEALVGHARWLPECPTSILTAADRIALETRTRAMITRVFHGLENLRAQLGGHLVFLMTPDGRAFDLDEATRIRRYFDPRGLASTMSDLFYVKGLLAAADYLNDQAKLDEAKRFFRQIAADIQSGAFVGEGVNFDPKVNRRPVVGRHSHGARMIALGACAMFARRFPDESEWFDLGVAYIRYILDRHINLNQFETMSDLQPHDMFEGSDAAGKPWREPNGAVLSDPGHSTEFVGLATKFLLELDRRPHPTPLQTNLLAQARTEFPAILLRNFRNGYNARVGGICKLFDLISRQPTNPDMPWWNLPETLRAAAEVLCFCPSLSAPAKREVTEVIQHCSNGFFRSFVNEKVHLMAYQTVNAAGQPVDVIPATADADPGYHTGLSIIDYLQCLARAPQEKYE